MDFIDRYKKAVSNLPENIKEAEVDIERKKSILIGVSGGQIVKSADSDVTSVYVRASSEKQVMHIPKILMKNRIK